MNIDHIDFGVWAPSQDVFWQSWIDAGICTAPGVFAPGYAEVETTADHWPGLIVDTPAVFEDGEMVTPPTYVPGWHCNVRVFGSLVVQFTAGLVQEGDVWQRTHAAAVFNLTNQPADPVTGFPAGMRSPAGVVYADANAFTSPSNIWA